MSIVKHKEQRVGIFIDAQNLYNTSTVNYFSKAVYGLTPNTTYYYRAAVTCFGSTKYGNVVTFHTPAYTYVKKKIVYNNYPKPVTEVKNTATCLCDTQEYLSLVVEAMQNGVVPGGNSDFRVIFKNTSNEVLRDVVIKVELPEGMTIYSVDKGQFTKGDHTFTIAIPAIPPQAEGAFVITGTTDGKVLEGTQMVVNAYGNYTVPTIVKAKQPLKGEVTGYAITIAQNGSDVVNANRNTTNSENDMWSWLPKNFTDWVIAILVFLVFIAALRYVFNAMRNTSN